MSHPNLRQSLFHPLARAYRLDIFGVYYESPTTIVVAFEASGTGRQGALQDPDSSLLYVKRRWRRRDSENHQRTQNQLTIQDSSEVTLSPISPTECMINTDDHKIGRLKFDVTSVLDRVTVPNTSDSQNLDDIDVELDLVLRFGVNWPRKPLGVPSASPENPTPRISDQTQLQQSSQTQFQSNSYNYQTQNRRDDFFRQFGVHLPRNTDEVQDFVSSIQALANLQSNRSNLAYNNNINLSTNPNSIVFDGNVTPVETQSGPGVDGGPTPPIPIDYVGPILPYQNQNQSQNQNVNMTDPDRDSLRPDEENSDSLNNNSPVNQNLDYQYGITPDPTIVTGAADSSNNDQNPESNTGTNSNTIVVPNTASSTTTSLLERLQELDLPPELLTVFQSGGTSNRVLNTLATAIESQQTRNNTVTQNSDNTASSSSNVIANPMPTATVTSTIDATMAPNINRNQTQTQSQNQGETQPQVSATETTVTNNNSNTVSTTVTAPAAAELQPAATTASNSETVCPPALGADGMCIVCQEQRADGVFVHAGTGHTVCCYNCALQVSQRNRRCPICRLRIDMVIRTFGA